MLSSIDAKVYACTSERQKLRNALIGLGKVPAVRMASVMAHLLLELLHQLILTAEVGACPPHNHDDITGNNVAAKNRQ